jgi:hypothetical protein
VRLGPATHDAYVGEYRGKDAFAITREGERLLFQFPPGTTVFEIVPESETQFFWKDAGRTCRSHEGEDATSGPHTPGLLPAPTG